MARERGASGVEWWCVQQENRWESKEGNWDKKTPTTISQGSQIDAEKGSGLTTTVRPIRYHLQTGTPIARAASHFCIICSRLPELDASPPRSLSAGQGTLMQFLAAFVTPSPPQHPDPQSRPSLEA